MEKKNILRHKKKKAIQMPTVITYTMFVA